MFILIISGWVKSGQLCHSYKLPSSLEEAEELELKNKSWYGAEYCTAMTTHLCPKSFRTGYNGPLSPMNMHPQHACGPEHIVALPPPDLGQNIPSMDSEADLESLTPAADVERCQTPVETLVKDQRANINDVQEERITLGSDNLCAIAIQVQQRVDHDIGLLLPRLYGLSNAIGDLTHLKLTKGTLDFYDILETIVGQLSQACGEDKDSELLSQDETMAGTTASPTQGNMALIAITKHLLMIHDTGTKHRREGSGPHLLPPSPEMKQK